MTDVEKQINELRIEAQVHRNNGIRKCLQQAADTIEDLSVKMAAANMERSDRYYGDETNLKKFKEWIANANIEQIAEYLLHEYDGILYTSDGTDFDDTQKLEAIDHEIEWLNAKADEGYWKAW